MKKNIFYMLVLVAVSLAGGIIIGTTLENKRILKPAKLAEIANRYKENKVKTITQNRKKLFDRMAKQLRLSEEQKEKAKAILESSRGEIVSLRKEAYAKLALIRQETNAKIQTILTPEQQERFQKFVSNHKDALKKKSLPKP